MSNPFEIINEEFEAAELKEVTRKIVCPIEAYQIVRLVKSLSGSNGLTTRIILDTIKVEFGNADAAKLRAIKRAKMIGNCMVVEKSEKVIGCYP